jgi:hypothetical protein
MTTKSKTKPSLNGTERATPDITDAVDPLVLEVEGLHYELDKPPTKNGKKVVARVNLASGQDGSGFVDSVDLYRFRSRREFAALVADSFARTTDVILGHLALLLDQVERAVATSAKKFEPIVLTDARKKTAEKLLLSPDLLDRAAKCLEALGYVGEERNKKLIFLVAVSRLMEKPLSAILFAPSGAGKSELLDKLAMMLAEEAVEFLSRLTPHALYYAGADHLRHKLIIVDEQVGASESDYAVRTLQTKGLLRLAVPVQGKIESFEARGPIALASGSTRSDLNPENLSRCLELVLDDSPEQTARIQAAQRQAWAGKKPKKIDTQVWKDAQRILEPLEVVVPYAEKLAFPSRTTKDRRDNMKLLTLIASHALLYQSQRERDDQGRVIATVADYAVIYDLLKPVVESELDGLSPKAATLYRKLTVEKTEKGITRREVAKLLGSESYMTAKRAVSELVAHELLREVGKTRPRRYQILDRSLLGGGTTLTPPETLG